MSKRLSVKERAGLIDAWKEGREDEVKGKGFYVLTNKKGQENVRRYKAKQEEGVVSKKNDKEKPVKEATQEKPKKKEDKENIL